MVHEKEELSRKWDEEARRKKNAESVYIVGRRAEPETRTEPNQSVGM